MWRSYDQRWIAVLVSSVPLSDTHATGCPQTAMIPSGSRATRTPPNEGVSDKCQAFAREVIDRDENAKAPSVGKRIGGEVEAPTPIGTRS
jgi:hypothetical protein